MLNKTYFKVYIEALVFWAMDKKYFDDRVGRECFCRRLGEIYQMIKKMDQMQPGWEYEYAESEHLKQSQVQSHDL